MFYVLNENVYLVKGEVNSCIYDFNSNNLYHINYELYSLLNRINVESVKVDSLTPEESCYIRQLIDKKIISTSDKTRSNDINALRDNYEKIKFAWIEVTTRCNLRCIHCYNESDAYCVKEMSIDDYKDVIDSLLKIDVKKIQIIGGEPFFNSQKLKLMLDYTVNKFEYIEIFTNATLITDEWYEYLSENEIRIAVSVYSYDCKMHDRITTIKGSFEKTNEAISKLKEYNIKYRVANILMKDLDIGEKNTDLYTLSNKRDIVRITGRASLDLLSDELIKSKLITKKTFEMPLNKNLTTRMVSGHNCFRNKLYISADKEVFPCVMERRFSHGKIKADNTIVFNDEILNLNKDMIEECKLCEFRYACFDCRPNSMSNNVLEKPWYCTYKPSTGEWENDDSVINNLRSK